MLLRRSSVMNEMGDELAEEMTDLVELSLVWFAVRKNKIMFFQSSMKLIFLIIRQKLSDII